MSWWRASGAADGGRSVGAVSDVAWARLGAGALWLLVGLAAAGGVRSWLVGEQAPAGVAQAPADGAVSAGAAAAGLGERFVSAYLVNADGEALERFLGYAPSLPDRDRGDEAPVPVVRAVEVTSLGDGAWSVVVGAGPAGDERFWSVGVARSGEGLAVTGLPTPVGAPVAGGALRVASLGPVPVGDEPVVDAVSGFVGAHACGQGELSRWLSPGAAVAPVGPPVCVEARLERWAATTVGEGRQVVVVEAALDDGSGAWAVTYSLELARRDGRWEVRRLLPAPPLDGQEQVVENEGALGD